MSPTVCLYILAIPILIKLTSEDANMQIREVPLKAEEWVNAKYVAKEFVNQKLMNYSARRFCFTLLNTSKKTLVNWQRWFFIPRKTENNLAPRTPEY